jgi:ergothioneine biosynthesis protein EgtB
MPDETSPMMNQQPISDRFKAIRDVSVRLCEPLEVDDYLLQSRAECSPPKWHLAHTTWFFETFLLAKYEPNYRPHHADFGFLFNSYYDAVGERWPRPARGLLSRPTVAEVYAYRRAVDERVAEVLTKADEQTRTATKPVLEIGLNHEQQHQELLLTDLKNAFALNPIGPVYRPREHDSQPGTDQWHWRAYPERLHLIGHEGNGFAFDNETPQHRVFVDAFQLASRPVTVEAYLRFMADDGYQKPSLWLSDGWAACQAQGWTAPLYWQETTSGWTTYTLAGTRTLNPHEPVCHVSFYEADAFARWAGARLPTEAEWEMAVTDRPVAGNFLDAGHYHPTPDTGSGQYYGDVWQWTASPYIAYPGYRPMAGALGEYNGKFMCNQMVLRGASCVTPADHARKTYRNFFPPDARWQFSGIRLAMDGDA